MASVSEVAKEKQDDHDKGEIWWCESNLMVGFDDVH